MKDFIFFQPKTGQENKEIGEILFREKNHVSKHGNSYFDFFFI